MTVAVNITNAHRRYRIGRNAATGFVRSVLMRERRRRADVSVVFVDSRFIRKMNRRFLGHDYVTDVISFPLDNHPSLEGEIYINLDRARAQAKEYGVPFGNEVARLVIHGTLHLAGYRDRTARQARQMRREECRHLMALFPKEERNR
jgi:rRNA maturation RNase YbeY